jgi:hypothetical protein
MVARSATEEVDRTGGPLKAVSTSALRPPSVATEGVNAPCVKCHSRKENLVATTTSLLPDVGVELREGYAEVGDINLHYVEAGEGPLVVLLHGFPEFWFGWRRQIAPLAAAGFRVVAPDRAGTTFRRSRRASRPTASTCSPPTSVV